MVVKEAGVTDITMHSKEIEIVEATFGAGLKSSSISYDEKATTVTMSFPSALPVGENVLSMKFNGILNPDMAGFYKSSYTDADGNTKIMASTQFEALDARRAFVCVDEPAVKATFKVAIICDQKLSAISNMPETSILHVPGGKKRVDFDVSPVMSTYILAWAIGEFDMVQTYTNTGVSIRIFSPPGRATHGNFALDAGKRALEFYNDFFGVPYPLPKLDMICCTEFAMGAMENWGLVTYREVDLMIDPVKASSQQKQRVAIVVAHELGHQWFGNLVTMEWWDGIWLNEGFAAWCEHFCVDALYPDFKIWEQYSTDAFGAALRLDSLKTSHPIIVPIKHAEEVEQVFDAISYCKGSTVVSSVFHLIGRENFQKGLKIYFNRHAYGNATTEDLWAAWSEASGKDISDLMDVWTTKMGYPYVKVVDEKWTDDSLEVTLEQNWFLADGSNAEESPIWKIPIMFETPSGTSQAEAEIMTAKQQTFQIKFQTASSENWIKINAGQRFFYRAAHSLEMTVRMKPALSSGKLSPIDRAAMINDAYNLAKAGVMSVESVFEILKALKDESSSVVFTAMSIVMGGFKLLLEQLEGEEGKQLSDAYTQFGHEVVKSALSKCGWEVKAEDTHTDKLFRATVIGMLDVFAGTDPEVVAEARRRFDEHFEDDSLLPSDYKSTVYKIVLQAGGEAEYERVLSTYNDTSDNAIRKYAMNTLGSTKNKDLKMRTLQWALNSDDVKLQDFFYPIGSVSGDAEGALIAWAFFQENFERFKEKLAKASPSLMDACIVYSCNKFCTNDKATEIEEFFAKNPIPSSERRISQLLENVRTSAQFLDRINAKDIIKVLK